MRLCEIVNNNVNYGDLIKEHCRPYLSEVGEQFAFSHFLYKGTWNPPKQPLISINGRPDSNIPRKLHVEFERVFQKVYGFPYMKAVFASTDIGQAVEYGDDVFAVFPVGNFQYCWSPTVEDMFYMTGDDEIEKHEIESAVIKNKFTTSKLKSAWKRPGEVMLVMSKAIMVPVTLPGGSVALHKN